MLGLVGRALLVLAGKQQGKVWFGLAGRQGLDWLCFQAVFGLASMASMEILACLRFDSKHAGLCLSWLCRQSGRTRLGFIGKHAGFVLAGKSAGFVLFLLWNGRRQAGWDWQAHLGLAWQAGLDLS